MHRPVGVSVIIPTLRNDRWLKLAIDSLLGNQGVNFEIIVVFDGTPIKNLPKWAEDERIHIIQKPVRQGQAAAMTDGLKQARFEFFARLDADDLSSSSRLSNQIQYLQARRDVVAVGTRVMRINTKGEHLGVIGSAPTHRDLRKQLILRNVVAHSSLMARTSALEKIGSYNIELDEMEDYEFILRLGRIGEIHLLETVDTYYRLHPSQISRRLRLHKKSMRPVTKAKRDLGRVIGMNRIVVNMMINTWLIAEIARAYGVRKPRYMSKIKPEALS